MIEADLNSTIWAGRLLVLGLTVVAAYTDYQERRVPNAIVVALLASGLLWHWATPPGDGLFSAVSAGSLGIVASTLGGLVAFACLFPLYCLRVLGAGDVKLAAALAAWIGWQGLLPWVLLVMLSGGALSLLWMLDSDRRSRVLGNLRILGLQVLATGSRSALLNFDPNTSSADRLPYAWAILGGTITFAAAQYYQWWALL